MSKLNENDMYLLGNPSLNGLIDRTIRNKTKGMTSKQRKKVSDAIWRKCNRSLNQIGL